VQNFIIIHAGADQAFSGNSNDIWSHQYYIINDDFTAGETVDGVEVVSYATVADNYPLGTSVLGTMVHEFGHLLGLPDLYDTDYAGNGGQSCGAGFWDSMAYGCDLGNGTKPAHLSAWSKQLLDWINPVNVIYEGDYSVSDAAYGAASSDGFYRLWTNGKKGNEYFLVENRQPNGFDAELPGAGLLIWHIDDSVGDIDYNDINTEPDNLRVALEQADVRYDLENCVYPGDDGDPFSAPAYTVFNQSTNPSSNRNDGSSSYVSVTNITSAADTMTAHFSVKQPVTGGGGGGGGSVPPQNTVPPGAATPLKDSIVEKAVSNSSNTGIITIEEKDNETAVTITTKQVKMINGANKPLSLQISDVSFTFPANALQLQPVQGKEAVQVEIKVRALAGSERSDLWSKVQHGNLYILRGEVYELSTEAVNSTGDRSALNNFNGSLRVSLPVPAEYQNQAINGMINAFRYNPETNAWELIGGRFNPATGSIVFETSHFSLYALLEMAPKKLEATPFTDINSHWAKADIEWMYNNHYVSGRSQTMFEPDAGITRAEFAALLVNVLKLENSSAIPFNDVPRDAWYMDSVARAYGAKLVSGTSTAKFEPQVLITREQMAVMIANVLKYKKVDISNSAFSLETFNDYRTISAWAKDSVSMAAGAGIIQGKTSSSGTIFAPTDNATRAEAVAMLRRLVDKI